MESKNKVFVRFVDFKAQEEEHAAAKLPEMEQSLITEFAERCKMGFAEYGPVFLGKRNWGKELKEEALDGLFYALMAAKTMEKYGDLIKALEEASDDELSMDACSPDPLKQSAYLVKQLSSELAKAGEFLASEKRISANLAETVRDLRGYDLAYLKKALEDEREAKRIAEAGSQKTVSELVWQRDEARKQRDEAEAQAEDLSERIVPALNRELGELRKAHALQYNRANHLAKELDRRLQERDNYRESCERLRKENLDMRALMESALSLGSPRG